MKKQALSSYLIVVIMLLLFSCENPNLITKNSDLEITEEEGDFYAPFFDLSEVKVINGLVNFESFSQFQRAYQSIGRHYTPEKLNEWERTVDFKSSRSIYEEASEKLEKIISLDELSTFIKEHEKYIFIDRVDKSIDVPCHSFSIAALLNRDGAVRIEEEIHIFEGTFQKVILDGDKEKIPTAKRLTRSTDKIKVFNREYPSNSNARGNHGTYQSKTGYDSDGDKRLKAETILFQIYNLSRGYQEMVFQTKIISEKKNWLGWWVSHKANLTFNVGFNARGTCKGVDEDWSSGTGWSHPDIAYIDEQWGSASSNILCTEQYSNIHFTRVGGTFGNITNNICVCFWCPGVGSCFDQCDVEGKTCW